MISAINIFLGIQLLTLMVVKIMNGSVNFSWNSGILFGGNIGSTYIKARDKDDEDAEESIYQMIIVQYHFICVTSHMTLLIERPDLIEDEMDIDQ